MRLARELQNMKCAGKPRLARSRAIARAKRAEHAELRRPTLAGVIIVCKREGIEFLSGPLSPGYEGWTAEIFGRPCIMLSSCIKNRRRKLFVLLHELGHVLLGHVSDTKLTAKRTAELSALQAEQGCSAWDLDPTPSPVHQAIEAEADLFAAVLVGGIPEAA